MPMAGRAAAAAVVMRNKRRREKRQRQQDEFVGVNSLAEPLPGIVVVPDQSRPPPAPKSAGDGCCVIS